MSDLYGPSAFEPLRTPEASDPDLPPYPRDFGSELVSAEEFVAALQAFYRITVDGLVGPQTWSAAFSKPGA